MEGRQWHLTGVLVGMLVLCTVLIGIRWSVLAGRTGIEPVSLGLIANASERPVTQSGGEGQNNTQPAQPAMPPFDLNTVTREQLVTLPGIGDVLAGRIVKYRELNGRFEHVSDLTRIEGIGEGKLAAIAGSLYVAGST